MTTGFISYTHADTVLKDQLFQHLASLRREGLIDLWHDGMLRPGEHLDPAVQAALSKSDFVILLVSADFIASEYCYEKEMLRAFSRQRQGTAYVIPIILRPCQWMGVPIGEGQTLTEFVALPKDGRPVTSWPDVDTALNDAVGAIRRMLMERRGKTAPATSGGVLSAADPTGASAPVRLSNILGITAKATDLDRDRFLRAGFGTVATLFEQSLAELKISDRRIDTDFERIDSRSFAASVYFDGKRVGQVSIWYGGSMMQNALCVSYDAAISTRNSMNDWLPVEDTPQGLVFSAHNTMSGVRVDGPLDAVDAGAYFWQNFLNQVKGKIR